MADLQEGQDHALYFDAYVVEIQRRLHDIGGCRCIFVVRYDHDNHEVGSMTELLLEAEANQFKKFL